MCQIEILYCFINFNIILIRNPNLIIAIVFHSRDIVETSILVIIILPKPTIRVEETE